MEIVIRYSPTAGAILARTGSKKRVLLATFILLGLAIGAADSSAEDRTLLVAENTKPRPDIVRHKHISTLKYEYLTTGQKRDFNKKPTSNVNLTTARDVASGQATGKRMHKPFTITKELDKATPLLAAPPKKPAAVFEGGLLEGGAIGGSATTSPAATGSPMNRGAAPAGRLY